MNPNGQLPLTVIELFVNSHLDDSMSVLDFHKSVVVCLPDMALCEKPSLG